jgi:hypothetical protein
MYIYYGQLKGMAINRHSFFAGLHKQKEHIEIVSAPY